jgi:hypothetical protein
MITDDRIPYDPDEAVVILNPSANDFTLDVVDKNNPKQKIQYIVNSRESLKLPRYAANCVSERLAQQMESKKTGVITQAYHEVLLNMIRLYKWEKDK